MQISVHLNVGANGKVEMITSMDDILSPPSWLFLDASELLVTSTSTKGNNCLLDALSLNASPKGRKVKGDRGEASHAKEDAARSESSEASRSTA